MGPGSPGREARTQARRHSGHTGTNIMTRIAQARSPGRARPLRAESRGWHSASGPGAAHHAAGLGESDRSGSHGGCHGPRLDLAARPSESRRAHSPGAHSGGRLSGRQARAPTAAAPAAAPRTGTLRRPPPPADSRQSAAAAPEGGEAPGRGRGRAAVMRGRLRPPVQVGVRTGLPASPPTGGGGYRVTSNRPVGTCQGARCGRGHRFLPNRRRPRRGAGRAAGRSRSGLTVRAARGYCPGGPWPGCRTRTRSPTRTG
jgi:hypothetical protein